MKTRTLAEHAQRELHDEQQHTTAWCESKYFRCEALVQCASALLAEDCDQAVKRSQADSKDRTEGSKSARRVCPVVLRHDTRDLLRALYTRLDNLSTTEPNSRNRQGRR